MGVFRSIIMSRNHLLVNAQVNSKATNGTTRFQGGSVRPANVFCQQIWSRSSHGVARPPREQIGGRRKSVLEPNLYLSVVYLWPQLFCFCWVLSTFWGRMIFVCVISFDWSKEGAEVLLACSRISIDMLLALSQHSPLQILQCQFHLNSGFVKQKLSSSTKKNPSPSPAIWP